MHLGFNICCRVSCTQCDSRELRAHVRAWRPVCAARIAHVCEAPNLISTVTTIAHPIGNRRCWHRHPLPQRDTVEPTASLHGHRCAASDTIARRGYRAFELRRLGQQGTSRRADFIRPVGAITVAIVQRGTRKVNLWPRMPATRHRATNSGQAATEGGYRRRGRVHRGTASTPDGRCAPAKRLLHRAAPHLPLP